MTERPDSAHLLDPQLRPLVELVRPRRNDVADLPEVRRVQHELMSAWVASLDLPDVVITEHVVAKVGGVGGPVRVLLYAPPSGSLVAVPAVMWIHGGGYVSGTAEETERRARLLVGRFGCVVASVDYRLSPEHPYPAALDDCDVALRWLHAEAGELGIDPDRIVVAGSSAGGGLAAALCLRARDAGVVPVRAQVLLAPMLDDRTAAGPVHPVVGRYVWDHAANRFGWTCYLGGVEPGAADVDPLAAPARHGSLGGLPPTTVVVGSLDLFVDEDIEYARRLADAGVPVALHVYPGAVHGFEFVVDADVVAALEHDLGRALGAAFGPPP